MALVNVGGKINLADSVANIDNKYGPYTSTQEAWDFLGPDNLDVLAIGLTVGIQATPTSPITEYWFKNACETVEDLTPKITGGSGAGTYSELPDKPSINNVELSGNKSLEDLGINIPTKNSELENDSNFITNESLENFYNKSEVDEMITYTISGDDKKVGMQETIDYIGDAFSQALEEKQDELTAGQNITITNNVISATGELSETTGFEGKIFSILGDSISTYDGYTPVADGFNLTHRNRYAKAASFWKGTVHDTWWMKTIETLGGKLGINDSWAGSRVSNSSSTNSGDQGPDACMASMTRITNLGSNGTPDVILFYGGTNDAGGKVAIGSFDSSANWSTVDTTAKTYANFTEAYRIAIQRLRYLYPNAIIASILPMVTTSYYTMSSADAYIEQVKEICDYFGILPIDLRKCGVNWENKSVMLGDGIHPTIAGMDLMAKHIIQQLKANYRPVDGESVVYSITNNLTNVTSSKSYIKGVSADKSYTTVLSPITGDIANVVVKMGGVDITSKAYNLSTKTINIAKVTGNVEITAATGEIITHNITTVLNHSTIDNTATVVQDKGSFLAQISPESYYNISNITVTMNGEDISSQAVTGTNITIDSVVGDVVITVITLEKPKYSITYNLTNVSTTNDQTELYEGSYYDTVLVADEGHGIDSISVTMGGVDITSSVLTDKQIHINSITGNIVITGTASVRASYPIIGVLDGITNSNGLSRAAHGESYEADLIPNLGWALDVVTVEMDSVDITSQVYSNGHIFIESVTGPIVIVAQGAPLSEYTVTNNLTNIINDNTATKIYENSSYSATLVPDTGYVLDSVKVEMGGADITAGVYASGVIYITDVTGDIVITASAKEGLIRTTQNTHAQPVDGVSCEDSLFEVLTPSTEYYGSSGWGTAPVGVYSVTVPVIPGDKIYSASFGKSGTNGGKGNGIRVTYFNDNNTVISKDPTEIYNEFVGNNLEYIVVPDGVNAVNIPVWSNESPYNIVKILTYPESPIATISYFLTGVQSSNTNTIIAKGQNYTTTLTPIDAGVPIRTVKVTANGENITNEVYNVETGVINIPTVNAAISITATASASIDTWYYEAPTNVSTNVNLGGRGWCYADNVNSTLINQPVNKIKFYTNKAVTDGVVTLGASTKDSTVPLRTVSATYTHDSTTKDIVEIIFDEAITIQEGEYLTFFCQESTNFDFMYSSSGGTGFIGRVPKVYGAGNPWTANASSNLGISVGYKI